MSSIDKSQQQRKDENQGYHTFWVYFGLYVLATNYTAGVVLFVICFCDNIHCNTFFEWLHTIRLKKIPIALKKGCIIEDHNIGTKIMLYHWALYVPLLYLRFVTVTPCGDCAITKVVLIIILTLHIYGNIMVFKNEKRGDQEYYNHFRYWI